MPSTDVPTGQPLRRVRLRAGPWGDVFALGAAVPAFYLALLNERPALVRLLYVAAAGASAWSAWRRRRGPQPPRRSPSPHGPRLLRHVGGGAGFSVVLGAALLLAAVLPMGDGAVPLAVRLAAAVLCLVRAGEAIGPVIARGSLLHLLLLAVTVLGLCGLGFWWLEPTAHDYGDGLWLAFTTAATVGYGDIVPTTPAAKIFAVFVVLLGLAVLSLVTAAIAAMWVQSEERRIEHEILRDLHRQLSLLRDEVAALRRPEP